MREEFLFANALPTNPGVAEVLVFQLAGLVVVLGALTVLYIALEIFGRILRESVKPEQEALSKAQALGLNAPTAGPSPEVVAAIAGAIAYVAGPRAQLKSVAQARPASAINTWSLQGRAAIHQSHKVR